MNGNSRFEDFDRYEEIEEMPVRGASVRDLVRQRDGVDKFIEPKKIEDKILALQLAHRMKKKKVAQGTTPASYKSTDDELASYINLKRIAKANYIREMYMYEPALIGGYEKPF